MIDTCTHSARVHRAITKVYAVASDTIVQDLQERYGAPAVDADDVGG